MVQERLSPSCPMEALLRLLTGPWTAYILWILRSNGPTRFGVLKRQIQGISARVLTERLRMLESSEIIYREYEATIPPQVTYGLAARGLELLSVLDQLNVIAHNWFGEGAPVADCAELIARES